MQILEISSSNERMAGFGEKPCAHLNPLLFFAVNRMPGFQAVGLPRSCGTGLG